MSQSTKYTKCESCGRYCEKTGGSDFTCDKDARVIHIDAFFGRDWREHLPTDEEWEEEAYKEYTDARDRYLANTNDPAAAWQFLSNHPVNRTGIGVLAESRFKDNLEIEYVYANANNEIDEDEEKNTKIQVWLEFGPYDEAEQISTHDTFCDITADTFEDGICLLADLIWRKYKNADHVLYAFAPDINAEWFKLDDFYAPKAVPGVRIEVHSVNHHLDANSNLVWDNPSEPIMLLGHIVEVDGDKVRIEIEEKVTLDG
jgi:hypothetical protein